MKLKLNVGKTAPAEAAPSEGNVPPAADAPAPAETPTTAGPKLKFKIKAAPAAAANGESTEAPKEKRKYVRKIKTDENGQPIPPGKPGRKPGKRANEDAEEGSPATKRKRQPSAKSLAAAAINSDDEADILAAPFARPPRPAPPVRAPSIKIALKPRGSDAPPALQKAPTFIKLKGHKGKPPVRPPGVGYDSEAEEAEDDPAIEAQFVLRMKPGPDCDALRKAIEERKVGVASSNGGVAVNMRFFDREGRRAIVSVFGHHYAAAMVDLPCVIESMKSWNKKDWVKTADVCQMLLVLGQVKDEEEAKNYPLPREVSKDTMQYAHGLTPPMHWVRKRRFRHRTSYRRIEEVEEQVEALLDLDRKAVREGGKAEYHVLDADHADSSGSEEDSDDDLAGEASQYAIDGETPTLEIDAGDMDNDELEAALAAGLMAEDEDVDVDGLFGSGGVVEVETPATAHDVAVQILGQDSAPPTTETPASASTPATQSADDDDDDGDESEEDAGAHVDEQTAENNTEMESLQDEIRELEADLANHWAQFNQLKHNVMFAKKKSNIIERLQEDIEIKKSRLAQLQGAEEDD